MPLPSASVSLLSQFAARGALGAAILAVLALAALHVVRRDVNPGWEMISVYAVGAHGWLMTLCFFAFSAASACLFTSLLGHTPTILGKIGLVLLAAATIGLFLGGAFKTDIALPAEGAKMSVSGQMHGMGFMIGVPGELLTVLLLSLALRGQSLWTGQPLLVAAAVVWISLAIMVPAMISFMKDMKMEGPGILGWTNRLFMIGYAGWIGVAAWPLAK